MIRLALVLLTGFALGILLTGNLFGAFYPVLFFDHLPVPLWLVGLVVGLVGLVGGGVARGVLRRYLKPLVRPRSHYTVAIITGVAGMAISAEIWRTGVVSRFAPDQLETCSFLASMHSAPRDFQFYLHSAMVKDCTAYGWNYRTKAPYKIPDPAVANIMPRDWFTDGTRCGKAWQTASDSPVPSSFQGQSHDPTQTRL
ncbi:MAG: hypothetical protein ACI8R4_004165 [Paracoccaceae bacterium]|jgi:hypothetical protein